MAAVVERIGYRAVLANREFRWLWLGQIQSTVGDQIGRVALAVLVFHRTGSSASTALTYALTYLPAIVSGPLLSGLADVLPRKPVMIVCDLTRAVLIGLMAVHGLSLVAIAALLVAATALESPFAAATNALVPSLFDGDAYDVASGLRTTANQAAQLVGFASGGILVTALGASTALIMDAATFLASAVFIAAAVRGRPAALERRSGARRGVLAASLAQNRIGLRLVFGDRRLRRLMLAVWASGTLFVAEGLAVPYAAQVHGPACSVGLLMAIIPLGYVVGTVLFLRLTDLRSRPAVFRVLVVLCGVPMIAMLGRPNVIVGAALWFTCGLSMSYLVYAMPTFARLTPDHSRGAAIGVAAAGLLASQGLSIWVFGMISVWTGPAVAIGLAGVLTVLSGARIVAGHDTDAVG